ncbi:hypothetical protein [Dyadobacter psychrotolerans]|uniref:Uncharacterized protein n=1 Tax=Dyadobacter psychrotolerans TaxID=2541721 RepID=A0A4R5DSF2_9BACT|nr:hypothetical protein [Dyadobacter psychrotolerans]TDE15190.1 hypothetical protein E0F88_11740 [Dyadobacter psychrotolerans]
MSMIKMINPSAPILFRYLLLFVMLIAFSSCSKKFIFTESAIVPAANGTIKVKKDKNENYQVDLTVTNLAPADKLVESRNTYVLWANTSGNGTKNLGQLKNVKRLFSKTLRSELKTATPFEPESFFITAENKADINYPDGQVVLKTR